MRLRGENSWVFVLNSQLHANASHCNALDVSKKALFSAKINMVSQNFVVVLVLFTKCLKTLIKVTYFFLCGFEIEKSA